MSKYNQRLLKADINVSTSGDKIIITPGAGEMPASWENAAVTIVIDHINLMANGATTLQFASGTSAEGQVVYGGSYTLTTGQAIVLENSFQNVDDGVMKMAPNRSFVIKLGSSVQVSGFVRYRLLHTN